MSDVNSPSGEAAGKRRRVLLVEDNYVTATAYKRMLEREGFEVVHVAEGDVAFAAIRDQQFDLVLLDLMLPEMDGVEILKRTHERNQDFGTPVVVLTEVDLGVVRDEVNRYGVRQFFTKTGADAMKVLESIKTLTSWTRTEQANPPPPGGVVQSPMTETQALKMAPAETLNVRKLMQVCPDPLEKILAKPEKEASETDSKASESGAQKRRFLFLW